MLRAGEFILHRRALAPVAGGQALSDVLSHRPCFPATPPAAETLGWMEHLAGAGGLGVALEVLTALA